MNRHFALTLLAAVVLVGCGRDTTSPTTKPTAAPAAPTNRVDIPPNVRENLGITFAKVERRAVTRTLRLPGSFELTPTARREHRAAAAGRIELLVDQYDRVEAGQPIYRIDSPRLRDLQQEIATASVGVTLARAAVDSMPPFFAAHEKHHDAIEKIVELWDERVKQLTELRSVGGGQAGELAAANAALAQARADFAETLEKEAELAVRKVESDAQLAAAEQKRALLIAALASLTGRPADELARDDVWQSLTTIEAKAVSPGVITSIGATSGSYVDATADVVTVVAPERVRFRARGYQSDLGRLSDGLAVQVVPPAGTSMPNSPPMTGQLALAPQGNADTRTIDLLVTPGTLTPWARDGVSAFLEVTLAGSDSEELAIPLACVVRDGLMPVIFRRDPRDPNKVIRMEADIGANDGRWIVVKSGVAEGNEIVHDGAYQLLVATSGTIQKGGHFHPDGTFHEGED